MSSDSSSHIPLLAERLKKLRGKRTREDIQEASGGAIRVPSLKEWETGPGTPNATNLVALANVYGVSTDYILCRTDERTGQTTLATGMVLVDQIKVDEILGIGSIEEAEGLVEWWPAAWDVAMKIPSGCRLMTRAAFRDIEKRLDRVDDKFAVSDELWRRLEVALRKRVPPKSGAKTSTKGPKPKRMRRTMN